MDTFKMYEVYQQGFSLKEVGDIFGITRQAVYDRFKNKKLKLRTKKLKPFIIFDSLKFTINKNGYYECTTIDRLMLHNLIYEKNKGEIPKGFEIHHIDGNKINNDLSNLLLVTPKEHALIHSERIKKVNIKKVKCIETGEIFNSIAEVAKKHNQHASNVSRYYIDGKRKLNGYTYEKIN